MNIKTIPNTALNIRIEEIKTKQIFNNGKRFITPAPEKAYADQVNKINAIIEVTIAG